MKSRHFRRSSHPLTKQIDHAIDLRQAAALPITTGEIVSDLVSTVPAKLMMTEFGRLVTGRVRGRLKARGEVVIDTTTWVRKTDMDVTNTEFKTTIDIKSLNLKHVRDRLAADKAVEKFLDKQAARLGRTVTMGEFEKEIDSIYAHHGF